ncbi:MAG: hypothetical protein ACREBG_08670 [Pyrinomonadaceae bacterium]
MPEALKLNLQNAWDALTSRALVRECLIILAFCLFTALLTWPYVTRLRDAVVDPGDPYLVAWILWWDFHQTFTDPLNLFHANVFYPFRYTLAFSEHCYGIALLFFPLFALGARPLTVHAVAIFFGFALCGYGAFRLARTLTNSYGVAWVAGIIFAFVPPRFSLMSHLPYLFSAWVPLLFEALVLFVRAQTTKRTVWLGIAFFMTGLTTISWLVLSLVPFALSAAVLLTRYRIWRKRAFWQRGALALGLAALALLPFLMPYYLVSKLYGFRRRIEEVRANSAWPIHWLSAEGRNKFWNGFGSELPDSDRFRLFPGLLPLLFSLAAILLIEPLKKLSSPHDEKVSREIVVWLDAGAVASVILAFIAGSCTGQASSVFTADRALFLFSVLVVTRLCLAYPRFLQRGEGASLIETLRSDRRGDAYWLSLVWIVSGFGYSLGVNFFFYRIHYDLLPFFESMRVASRGSMIAYLGLAVLAGLGVQRLAEAILNKAPGVRPAFVNLVACVLLLFELNAAPLKFMRGDVYPDAVTLRLKETPMRGGIVVLPASGEFNHRHMLRAADHAKPLIVGTSGFNSPYETEIEILTLQGTLTSQLLDLLEKIPASYLVVQEHLLKPERRADYEAFLARGIASGRLRFIGRFDGHDDLYVVTKTEPDVQSEAPAPVALSLRSWRDLVHDDPVNMLNQFRGSSQTLYRIYKASYGRMPRYEEFIRNVERIGKGVIVGDEGQEKVLEQNLRDFAEDWVANTRFKAVFGNKSNQQYINQLFANAEVKPDETQRAALIAGLDQGTETHATALLKIVDSEAFVQKEQQPSLVLLHFFGYLRRNPGDPPDKTMDGFYHWLKELKKSNDVALLTQAFASSIEYQKLSTQGARASRPQ